MFLKISDGKSGWHFIDGVDRAYLSSDKITASSVEELNSCDFGEGTLINLIPREFFNGKEVVANVLECYKGESKRKVLFCTCAYLCNDNGGTVERINPNGFNFKQVRRK